MAFRCSRCGGSVVFDAALQMMRCEYCDSTFPPEQFEEGRERKREEIPEAGLALFTCEGCGAELQGTEDSVVGFCPYCGGQSLLQASAGRPRAESVLPFQVTREQCASLYHEHAKKVLYLPKDLKNAEHLERFTGIYMPYFEYDVDMGRASITGTKTVERHARYDVVNTYRIDASVQGGRCTVPYDASRYLDDEIAARVLPFDTDKALPYDPSYLSGFYADVSTVPPETYYRDAEAQASKDVVEEVAERIYAQEGITVDTSGSSVEAHTRGHRVSLMPMWFLTWRKGERVAYSVVNGESGKIVSDLPVDAKAFGVGCVIIAAILFALLEVLVQPTPLATSIVSLIAGFLMAISVRGSTKRIFEKQTHANDKGWMGGAPAAPDTGKKGKKKAKSGSASILWPILFCAAVYAVWQYSDIRISAPHIVAVAAVAYLLFAVWRVSVWQRSIPEKQPIRAILLVFLGVVLNAVIVFWAPVNDAWYYLGDALCILILVLASVSMTNVYNIGTTRPLPKLFDRNEVG